MNKDDLPRSENIGRYEAGNHYVTAASWESDFGYGRVKTYEIGIRELDTGKFYLLQSEKYNHQSVQEVANAIAHLLGIKGECYTPEWMQEYFT